METQLTIQQVAEKTGLSVHTLRYYEHIGLISQVDRASNGHRRYSERDISWIEFLMRLRTTGMPILKMQRFAELVRKGDATVSQRRALLESHRREVQKRIQELTDNLAVIDYKIERYSALERSA